MAKVRDSAILGRSNVSFCLTQLLLDEHDFISERELRPPGPGILLVHDPPPVFTQFECTDEDPSLWATPPSIQLFSTSPDQQISGEKKLEPSTLGCQL